MHEERKFLLLGDEYKRDVKIVLEILRLLGDDFKGYDVSGIDCFVWNLYF
jgi:hypothetical protein